jgi:thioredoxin 1
MLIRQHFKRFAQEYGDRLAFGLVDVNENESISDAYDVWRAPTVIVFRAGEVLDRLTGPKDEDEYRALAERLWAQGIPCSPSEPLVN